MSKGEPNSTFQVGELVEMGRVGDVAVSPCESWAAVSVARQDKDGAKYVSSIWRISLVDESRAVQLTFGEDNNRSPGFRRDGSLAFLSDRKTPSDEEGEGKRSQIWLLPTVGGESRPLTDEPLGITAFKFSRSANRLVVQAPVLPDIPTAESRAAADDRRKNGPSVLSYKKMPVRHWDDWQGRTSSHFIVYDEEGSSRQDITPGATGEYFAADWDVSPDGALLAVTRRSQGKDRLDDLSLEVFDLVTGTSRIVTPPSLTEVSGLRISPSSAELAFVGGSRSGEALFDLSLFKVELDGDKTTELTPDWDHWPQAPRWESAATILVTCSDNGHVPIYAIDIEGGEVTRRSGNGCFGNLTPTKHGVVAIHSTFVTPPGCVLVAGDGLAQTALPRPAGTDCPLSDLVETESHEVTSDDGVKVQYFVVRPKHRAGEQLPAIVWIHGGPIGQWSDGWHWRWQAALFALAGYTLVLANPRGSTGQGYEFTAGIWGNVWGDQCFRDVMAVTEAAAAREDVDPSRIAAMGGSFGGYMTNWIGTQTDRFSCLVTHASLFSFPMFHGTTDRPAWWALMLGCTPYDRKQEHERYSPQSHLANWKSPTLILHGERDYRVPIGEALALFEGLQLHGVESELVVFPDENHWILKPRNIVAWYQAALRFLERHLKSEKVS